MSSLYSKIFLTTASGGIFLIIILATITGKASYTYTPTAEKLDFKLQYSTLFKKQYSYALSTQARRRTAPERKPIPVGEGLTYESLLALQEEARNAVDVVTTQTHVTNPTHVRALYMSSWTASTPSLRKRILDDILTSNGNLNAVVIDIKDDTGKITFLTDDAELLEYGSMTNRISDIKEFIEELHTHNIYVIGRIAVFQDPYLTKLPLYTQYAVQKSDGTVWKDRKGLSWFDASSEKVWEYIVEIAEEAHGLGFDEINLDYVRFPTDGSADRVYPLSKDKTPQEVMKSFFAYMDEELRTKRGIPISADIFGMVTTQYDDMGIGQVLEDIAPHVDALAPMVYPSHYPKSFHGYANPADNPYEIITIALSKAQERLDALPEPHAVLRPWLQDFNLGATYTPDKVFAQIQASADLGIDSWMMWDASNTYTRSAYQRPIVVKEPTEIVETTESI